MISVKKTIGSIKESVDYEITFLLGGNAFVSNPSAYKEVGGDLLLSNFDDIQNLDKGVERSWDWHLI